MKRNKIEKKYEGCPIARVEQAVPFHDIDSIEVTWHGHYLKYFEIARCKVLSDIDYDYPQMRSSGYAWPVVDASARYIKPARYGDQLEIIAVITEWEIQLVIRYFIYHRDTDILLSKGKTVQVSVSIENSELQFGSPECLSTRIQKWRNR